MLKKMIYNHIGPGAYQLTSDFKQLIKNNLDSKYRHSVKQLLPLKDKYKGKRCFLIANGPSLNKMDLSLLKNEYTFGLNRIYLLFEKMGFETTFLVAVNKLVLEQFSHEVNQTSCFKFIRKEYSSKFTCEKDNVFVSSRPGPTFYPDITSGVWEGATVTYVAMQIAYFLGFSEVILVGLDHYFATKGKPHEVVVSQGDDMNHFDPNYFGKGVKWALPNLETSELAYSIAKYQFEKSGRKIIDATVDGNLQVFPKQDYNALF